MSNYRRGASLEYRVCDRYRDRGYYVMRGAGSHTVVDVIAMDGERVLLFQCKHSVNTINTASLLKEENVKLFEKLPVPRNAFKFLILQEQGKRNWEVIWWNKGKWNFLDHDHLVYKFVTKKKRKE